MNHHYEVIAVASGSSLLDEVAKQEGVRVIPIEMTRKISPLRDLKSLWKLCKIIIKEKPDIVHTHTPKAGALGMFASWLCKIPIRLHTVAGLPLLEANGIKGIILVIVERITYRFATEIYPNSFGLQKIIIENKFCLPEKLKVIGNGSSNGIDSLYFSIGAVNSSEVDRAMKKHGIGSEEFVFIFIGRLVEDKGISELISAFGNVYKKHNNSKLILVGSEERELYPLQNQTLKTITDHPSIIQTGWVSDVRPFLALSKVLVFPSYREGLPNVLLQACAMGIPCITTDINGCNEIITDEFNGLLIQPKDSRTLNLAMERLINDKELYNKVKLNTRSSVIERYNQNDVWHSLKNEYDEHIYSFLNFSE